MHFLVTGGAGFLGSALANRLHEEGHRVSVLDDLSSGERDRLHPDILFTQGDIDNIPLLWSLLHDVDCVYHLAARVSVAQSILHPRDYNRVNVGGSVSLMEAMRDTGVHRVVFTSSGAVYGSQENLPVREIDPPHPDSPYAVSKWSAEQYVHTIGQLWGLETVALRIFNTYGPNQRLPMSHAPVIPRFLQQVLTGGSIVLFGSGKQTRDFVYIDDVLEALVRSATAEAVNRGIINIGSGRETSISELVKEIARVTGHEINLINNPSKSGGVPRLVADISRARELLDFETQTSLQEGLRLTMERDYRFQRFISPAPA
jgi:UDP-glucose 4-epimerase